MDQKSHILPNSFQLLQTIHSLITYSTPNALTASTDIMKHLLHFVDVLALLLSTTDTTSNN